MDKYNYKIVSCTFWQDSTVLTIYLQNRLWSLSHKSTRSCNSYCIKLSFPAYFQLQSRTLKLIIKLEEVRSKFKLSLRFLFYVNYGGNNLLIRFCIRSVNFLIRFSFGSMLLLNCMLIIMYYNSFNSSKYPVSVS